MKFITVFFIPWKSVNKRLLLYKGNQVENCYNLRSIQQKNIFIEKQAKRWTQEAIVRYHIKSRSIWTAFKCNALG